MCTLGNAAVEVFAINYGVPQEIADFPHDLVIRLDICQARLQTQTDRTLERRGRRELPRYLCRRLLLMLQRLLLLLLRDGRRRAFGYVSLLYLATLQSGPVEAPGPWRDFSVGTRGDGRGSRQWSGRWLRRGRRLGSVRGSSGRWSGRDDGRDRSLADGLGRSRREVSIVVEHAAEVHGGLKGNPSALGTAVDMRAESVDRRRWTRGKVVRGRADRTNADLRTQQNKAPETVRRRNTAAALPRSVPKCRLTRARGLAQRVGVKFRRHLVTVSHALRSSPRRQVPAG